jgi:hypothetical protein
MSITSKIVLSALLVGITVPAFAQSGSVSNSVPGQKPAVTMHAPRIHKVASTIDATKPGAAVSTGTMVNTGIVGSTKPAAKSDAIKTEAPKAGVTTGVAASTKPASPAVQGTTMVAPKTN